MTACAQRPLPTATSYPVSAQQKMQAVHHWDVLAENLAASISDKLSMNPGNRPVYLAADGQNSDFGRALHNMLTSRLLERGVAVSTAAYGGADKPLLLKIDTQVVNFNDREGLRPLPGDFTLPKGLAYLIYRAGDLWAAPVWAVLPLSEYHENYFPAGTNTEIVVNAAVTDGARVVFSESRTYYVDGVEQGHYAGPPLAPAPATRLYKAVDQ
ncbi:MAG: hypothetical protein EPN21_07380 [Methylococcaceae bacterium]|nr:MAG: hypothetical protein EPN21_07380 [Methylococcaceae bacterium]